MTLLLSLLDCIYFFFRSARIRTRPIAFFYTKKTKINEQTITKHLRFFDNFAHRTRWSENHTQKKKQVNAKKTTLHNVNKPKVFFSQPAILDSTNWHFSLKWLILTHKSKYLKWTACAFSAFYILALAPRWLIILIPFMGLPLKSWTYIFAMAPRWFIVNAWLYIITIAPRWLITLITFMDLPFKPGTLHYLLSFPVGSSYCSPIGCLSRPSDQTLPYY